MLPNPPTLNHSVFTMSFQKAKKKCQLMLGTAKLHSSTITPCKFITKCFITALACSLWASTVTVSFWEHIVPFLVVPSFAQCVNDILYMNSLWTVRVYCSDIQCAVRYLSYKHLAWLSIFNHVTSSHDSFAIYILNSVSPQISYHAKLSCLLPERTKQY